MTEVTRTREVVNDDVDEPASPRSLLARIIWYIAGVIIALLALRFILILLGANSANGFVNFIYTISYPLARPFFGIFNYTIKYGISRFEIASLVAIAIYALVAYGIARLILIDRASV